MPFATSTDGIRLHYSTWGQKTPPLVMVHGLGADKWGWVLQRVPFGAKFRCIALDNRGSGRSDKPAGDYDLEQMSTDIVSVLDHAGVASAHVMGASMGGVLAMIAALQHPERVRSLTLVCTAARLQVWRRELFEGWINTAETSGMRTYVTQNLSWMVGQQSWRRLWPLANVIGPLAVRAPVHGLVGQIRGMLDAADSSIARLGEITVPTLVIVGSNDILTPPPDSELLAAAIPNARLEIIHGAAHGLMIEHASTFNRIVLDFLRSVPEQPISEPQQPRPGP